MASLFDTIARILGFVTRAKADVANVGRELDSFETEAGDVAEKADAMITSVEQRFDALNARLSALADRFGGEAKAEPANRIAGILATNGRATSDGKAASNGRATKKAAASKTGKGRKARAKVKA